MCDPPPARVADGAGYATYRHVLLHPASNVTGSLGALAGDDAMCRRVCSAVPGWAMDPLLMLKHLFLE